MRTITTRLSITAAAAALLVGGAAPALASSDDVVHRGSCSGPTDWKLKLSHEDNKIEVEYEIDSNKAGQVWNVRLFHDGVRFFAGQRTTQPPSGSFEVRRLTANHAGTDSFRGRAVNVATGEVCGGAAQI